MKLKTIGALLSAIALVSCSVEPLIEDLQEPSGDFEKVILRAHNFIWADNPSTRTSLTISETDGAVFAWAAGDIVGIYPDVGTQVRFPIVEGIGQETQVARFTGGGWAVKGAHQYMAYYPFIPDMDLDKTAVPVDYTGQIQDGNASTAHLSPFDYMAAAAEAPSDGEISFDFLHLGSLLMLNLIVPKVGEYNTLTLTCNGVPFATKGTVDITAETPVITPTDWSNEFVVHLNNLTTTQANENVVIFAMIPPVDMSEQTITVNLRGDHTDCETSFTRGKNKPFLAGRSYRPSMGAMAGGDVIKLESGHKFNEDIKTLVNGEYFIYDKTDYRIKSVSFEVADDEVPTEYARVDVSAPDSPSPIYAYWKPETSELVVRTPSIKLYANQDASGMFNHLDQLTSIDFTGFDLTYCSSVAEMFGHCRSLTDLDLSMWNTHSVSDFSGLFTNCRNLKNVDLHSLDMTSATNIGSMFALCSSLEEIDLSGFNTPVLDNIGWLFYFCTSLKQVVFGNTFNTSNVSRFEGVFEECSSLESIDISSFNMENATSYWRLFSGCINLKTILGNTPVRRGTTVTSMYTNCRSLTTIDVSDWDVSETDNLSGVFQGCSSLQSLDIKNWKVSNVVSFDSLFSGCSSLTDLDISSWNTSSAETMAWMFCMCSSLTSLDVSHFATAGVKSFQEMFNGCSSLQSLDVSGFITSEASDFDSMFSGCSSLIGLDLSNFDISKTNSLYRMFADCSSLVSLDLSSFDISHVRSLAQLFIGCASLKTINYGVFDTHYCEDFQDMFRGCSGLEELDLSFFDTSSAKKYENMFYGCSSITRLDISSFDTSHIDADPGLAAFIRDCFNLQEIRLGNSFHIVGPWYFATDLARDVENCTIYCSQDFKDEWYSSYGIWGPDDSKLIWLNCDTGDPLE